MWLGFTKADVLGEELVVNGDFVSPTTVGWSNEYDSIFIVENNTLKVTAGSTGSAVSYTINGLTIGTKYNISWGYTVGSGTLPKWRVFNSDQSGKSYSDVSNSFYFIPTATSVKFSPLYQCGTDGTFYFDNISVKEVAQFIPDKSTNSNNAKLFTGKALEFNGNDSVDLGTTFQGIKTIAFWCNTDTPANRTVLGLSSSYSTYIQVIGSVIAVKPPVGVRLNFNFDSLSLDTWYRVVVSVNSDNLVECYLDGIKSLDTYTTAEYLFGFNQIGRRQLTAEYWDGKLSDIQLYNAAWDSDDAAYDYANPNKLVFNNSASSISVSNLKGYYALSEGSGSIAYDSSGEGNNGAITGATYDDKQPTIPQLGMVDWAKSTPVSTVVTLIEAPNDLGKDILGNALRLRDGGFNLDGSGYAEVADDSTVNPTAAMTLQCWIQSNTESNKGLVAKWTNAEKDYMLLKTTSNFKFYIGANNGESGTIPTSGWVNIAGTYDGANIKTYIDGVLSTTTPTTGSIPNSTNILDIGRYNNSQYYSERIDEVMVYNIALTQKEITNNYNVGLSKHQN